MQHCSVCFCCCCLFFYLKESTVFSVHNSYLWANCQEKIFNVYQILLSVNEKGTIMSLTVLTVRVAERATYDGWNITTLPAVRWYVKLSFHTEVIMWLSKTIVQFYSIICVFTEPQHFALLYAGATASESALISIMWRLIRALEPSLAEHICVLSDYSPTLLSSHFPLLPLIFLFYLYPFLNCRRENLC